MTPFDELVRTTLCLGVQDGDQWVPLGCGFVVSDQKLLWLVTSGAVLERAQAEPITVWVSRHKGGVLLGLGIMLENAGLSWIRSEDGRVGACVFPAQPEWEVKAIPLLQSAAGDDLQPLQEVHGLAFPYGVEGFDPRVAYPLLLPGGIAGLDAERTRIYHTASSLPLSEGAPLMLATGAEAQRQLLLAGVGQGPLKPAAQVAPRDIPATVAGLSQATPIGAVVKLVGSAAAREQHERVQAQATAGDD